MIAVETPVKAHGNVVGYLGFNDEGELFARVEGHGWEPIPAPPFGTPLELVSATLQAALSDAYDQNAGYL